MKSTRFNVNKSFAITALMLVGIVQAGEFAESVAEAMRNRGLALSAEAVADQLAETAQNVATPSFAARLYQGVASAPGKAWGAARGAASSAAGWTKGQAGRAGAYAGERLGQLGGYMASKSPAFAQKWIEEHPVLAATLALGTGAAVTGLGTYGAKSLYERYQAPSKEAAKQYYDEIVNGRGLEEAVGGPIALEALYKAGKERYAPYLSKAENDELDKLFQARKLELEAVGQAEARKSEEDFKVFVVNAIEGLKQRINELSQALSILNNKVQDLRRAPAPVAVVSSVAPSSVQEVVSQPAAAQPLSEAELRRIYGRLSSRAGIQGIRNDAGLIARIRASSHPMAQNILNKI